MATPFPFGSGNVLLASQLNAITTLPVSTKTASHTLTIADLGTRVVMNSASATTITVNTSIFSASDVVEIANIGAGVCTITAGTATVTTTGSLALAQNASGKLIFISASAAIYVAGGVAASAGGLVFISGTTFSAASTVSLPANTFSATYANYKIIFNVTAASTDSTAWNVRMRASGTDSSAASYYYSVGGCKADAVTFVGAFGQGLTLATLGYIGSSDVNSMTLDVIAPQVTQNTQVLSAMRGRDSGGNYAAMQGGFFFNATTSFDSLTIYPAAGTITGNYKVYGYANS